MILHNVSDNTEIVEIPSSALSAERFFERDENGSDTLPVPRRSKDPITETQSEHILHHLLAQIMVDPVHLIFAEQRREMIAEPLRTFSIPTEGLLYDNPGPSSRRQARFLDIRSGRFEHGRRQSQIEQPIRVRIQPAGQLTERVEGVISAGHIRVLRPKGVIRIELLILGFAVRTARGL